jgi:ribonuclease HI
MSKKQKYYVVWTGRQTGIFTNWEACNAQVKGYSDAKYKSFPTREDAEAAFGNSYDRYQGKRESKGQKTLTLNLPTTTEIEQPILDSYAVDASCLGNPGSLEYRCVHTDTGKIIFQQGPFQNGTNNIGEFLAIVYALAVFKHAGITEPIYSDSETAMIWLKAKKCRTKLRQDDRNLPLFNLIKRAESWLQNNNYENQILKWQTQIWGEIPADYGRK